MRTKFVVYLFALVTAITAASAMAAGTRVTVRAVRNSALKETILVDGRGVTLYRLSAERDGKIHCTGSCATIWPPLVVARGAHPSAGPGVAIAKLSTVRRPDGRLQVAYRKQPLYFFMQDKKPGDAKGQGVAGFSVVRP
jgi:predicted lipoprotein with Yx(FWY)xxD motif